MSYSLYIKHFYGTLFSLFGVMRTGRAGGTLIYIKCPNRPMCPHVYNIVYKMLKLWLKNNISHCYTRHCWMNHKSYPNNYSSNLTYSLSWHSTLSADSFLMNFFRINVVFTLDCYNECRRS